MTGGGPPVGAGGDREGRVARLDQGLDGPEAAPAGGADDVQRVLVGDLVGPPGQLGQGDEDGTRNVLVLVLIGVADIEHRRALGVGGGEGVEVHLERSERVSHGSIVPGAGGGAAGSWAQPLDLPSGAVATVPVPVV